MKVNAILKFQLNEHKKGIMIYYFVMLCVIILSTGSVLSFQGVEVEFTGLEIATMIFLFVCGLNGFKEAFYLALQNGITRKELFKNRLLMVMILATFMALVDELILNLLNVLGSQIQNFPISGLVEMVYGTFFSTASSGMILLVDIGFKIFLYAFALSVGYFIRIGYYRMNKSQRIAVSVGVPIGLTYVLPFLDTMLYQAGVITTPYSLIVLQGLAWMLGIPSQNPIMAMVSFFALTVIFSGFSWLMLRKAGIKN